MKPTSEDIAKVQKQLSETCNDSDLAILECFCFDLVNETFDHNQCKVCPTYIDFAKRHPNHFPRH